MIKFLARRFLTVVPTLLIIMTLVFFMIRAVPGGPFDSEKKIPDVIKKNIEKKFHMDEPLIMQYFRYMGDVLFKFDFGPSFKYRAYTVNEWIANTLPVSFALGLSAMAIAFSLGIVFGIISALKRNSFFDYFSMSIAILGISTPLFVIAPIFILIFARWLQWVPVAGWGKPQQMLIPVLALSMPYLAYITRLTKAGFLEILRQDFIRTARAKGLSEFTVITRHVLKGGIIPVVSFLGPAFAQIITGSMVIERICNIPGLGRAFIDSSLNRDYTMVAGVMVTYAAILMAMNFIVDILYAFLDPRVKYS